MDIQVVNNLLEQFNDSFYEIEELALKQGIKSLTTTELHLIEAVGTDAVSMNELADKLGITMGTATVAISKLSKKKFIDRKRCEQDRRKVFVSLNKNGIQALNYHNDFHKTIINNITAGLSEEELSNFVSVFQKILKKLDTRLEYIRPDNLLSFSVGSDLKILEIKGSSAVKSYFSEKGIVEDAIIKINDKTKDILKIEKNSEQFSIDPLDAKSIIAIKVKI